MTAPVSIVWFRLDLRLDDNPALGAARRLGGPIVPLFVWAPEEEQSWQPGGASRWWLHHSLESLAKALDKRGCPLVVRRGPGLDALRTLVKETDATHIFWNRRHEPAFRRRDGQIKKALREDGLVVDDFNGSLLFEPPDVHTKDGKPYQVFTAFWKACRKLTIEKPLDSPAGRVPCASKRLKTLRVADLELLPNHSWPEGLAEAWRPGEESAVRTWAEFLQNNAASYETERDFPSVAGTSRLSPHLHFGEISPRRLWWDLSAAFPPRRKGGERDLVYAREIGWREFAHHLLFHFSDTTHHPLRPRFAAFPWRQDKKQLRAWQRGLTGYPIVDAGMRQLWKTGWMHNRVRMVVGSFLVKHLLIAWQFGAAWFWDTLVDADLANNTLGWQWCAGCGADAAPYFRIFNPMTQGKKFDPEGKYVKQWVPELAQLTPRWIHSPWLASTAELATAGIRLGSEYPLPIVDHAFARDRALAAFASIKN